MKNKYSGDNSTPGNKPAGLGALWLNKFQVFFDHQNSKMGKKCRSRLCRASNGFTTFIEA